VIEISIKVLQYISRKNSVYKQIMFYCPEAIVDPSGFQTLSMHIENVNNRLVFPYDPHFAEKEP